MDLLGYRAFATELLKIATEVRDADIRAMIAEAHGKEYLNGGALRTNTEVETNFKPKLAASNFMAFTPVGTYNVQGRQPKANSPAYETASNFVGQGLRGAMTGAGAATLLHKMQHGHSWDIPIPKLRNAAMLGAGVGLADRYLRRRSVKHQLEKKAMAGSFTPARQLHATQSQGSFENKVHKTPLKTPATAIGRDFRLPPQGA